MFAKLCLCFVMCLSVVPAVSAEAPPRLKPDTKLPNVDLSLPVSITHEIKAESLTQGAYVLGGGLLAIAGGLVFLGASLGRKDGK